MRVAILLCLLVCTVFGIDVPCTYTSKSGDYYDLSPLSDCSYNGYLVDSDQPYTLNICNQVLQFGCTGNAAVCQRKGDKSVSSAGKADQASFSDLPIAHKGVALKYTGGDPSGCPNNVGRSSIVNLVCDEAAYPEPEVYFVNENPQCTYNFEVRSKYACPTTKAPQKQWCKINVFLVPHTHDDVGWQITIDEYYDQQVRQIINSVQEALAANPARKFSYVEQGFFTKWWYDGNVTADQRKSLMNSYKNGQFEFVIGGWTMNDDACTTFGTVIDQLTLGHQFIYNTFGARPNRGWQLDPFGSGSVLPYLEKLAGFESHLIDRVTLKPLYQATQALQFDWQGVPSQGEAGSIFTEIMDGDRNAYCNFMGDLDFQEHDVTDDNVAKLAQYFYGLINQRVPHFKTNNILAQWGCDFHFQQGVKAFNNMDKLMAYMAKDETNSQMHVQYATVSDYFNAVKASSASVTFPKNIGGDFFTYTDGGTWSGYFTSRTVLKGLVREGEAAGRASEQLFTFGRNLLKNQQDVYDKLYQLRKANGQATHHDGVTGTSQPHVVDMYKNDIINAMGTQYPINGNIIGSIISASAPPALDFALSDLINIKSGQQIAVVLYNSLGWVRQDVVSLPTNYQNLIVTDSNNKTIVSQVNAAVLSNAKAKYNLFFEVSVPALGFVTYFVQATSASAGSYVSPIRVVSGGDTTVENSVYSLVVSGDSNTPTLLSNKKSSINIAFDQQIYQYTSNDDGGAYVFHPTGLPKPVSSSPPKTVVSKGKVVTEVFQVYPTPGNSYASQSIRLYEGSTSDASGFVEFSAQIGVLPDKAEVISHFKTNLSNGGVFYTDNNGFSYVERANTYPIEPIEMQHYPSIYCSYLNDVKNNIQFSILPDRAHSAASLFEGEMEVMLHRSPAGQDYKGLDDHWVDLDVAYPVNRVIVDKIQDSKLATIKHAYLLNFPLVHFSSSKISPKTPNTKLSFLKGTVPPNIHLQSLLALDNNSTRTILRLTHLFAVGEHPEYSKDVTLDLTTLFGSTIKSIQETTLTVNKVIATNVPSSITLTPKAIRTFAVTF